MNTGSLHRRLLNSIQNLDFLINSISIHEDHILNTDAENFNAKSSGVLKVLRVINSPKYMHVRIIENYLCIHPVRRHLN